MSPDWLGSPQHVVAGLVLGAAAAAFARRRIRPVWLVLLFALGVVALAELVVELVEYPLLYGADAHARAYYDTIADMATTLLGGGVGALLVLLVPFRRSAK
jgi:tartrate dehydratase beta subunit/fumarate hydratase class I family protein